jgi:hypothetical protein
MSNTLVNYTATAGAPNPFSIPRLRDARRLTQGALALGLLGAWLARNDMSSDGISYLDLGAAVAQGHWSALINGYWSPLYAAVLGGAFVLLRPSPFWEFSVAHLISFAAYVAALAAFRFFLAGLLGWLHARGESGIPERSISLVAYVLFLWTSLHVISLSWINPDMLVAAFTYLAVGCILRIAAEPYRLRWFLALGLALGFGYLTKSPFFLLSIVFLAVGVAAGGGIRNTWKGLAAATAVCGCLSGPYVFAISRTAGHFTFGESSRLNWAWFVGDIPSYHWQGGDRFGTPVHPTRKLVQEPPVYEFAGPLVATYAPWIDPSYWYAGIRWRLSWTGILRNLLANFAQIWDILITQQPEWLMVSLALLLAVRGDGLSVGRAFWILLIPSVLCCVMYAPVHVESRMLGPFITLFWCGVLTAVRVPDRSAPAIKWVGILCLAASFCGLLQLGTSFLGEVMERGPRHLLRPFDVTSNFEWQVAQSLKQEGLSAGDQIAWIRPQPFTARESYYWARLARLRIIAEIPAGQESRFWSAPSGTRANVLQTLARAGAKALIATHIPATYTPDGAAHDGWRHVGKTNYYVYLLNAHESH